MPKRIQRKRTKGWRMPANTVYVGRPTRWGNPFVGWDGSPYQNFRELLSGVLGRTELRAMLCHDKQPERADHVIDKLFEQRDWMRANLESIRGKDLACWCGLGPCHADVLLEIANK